MWSTLTRGNAGKVRLLATLLGLWLGCSGQHLLAQSEPSTPKVPAPIPSQRSPADFAMRVMHLALHEAVWGQPAFCTVRQQIEVYKHNISGFGKFVRMGKGSGKLKLSLQFPAGDSMNSLLQISDGQRLHTIEDIGGIRRRTIVDLDKVRQRLIINNTSILDPTVSMYLAIGGQAEAIRKLCQQYEWNEIRQGQHESVDVWMLGGQLASVPPQVRAHAPTDSALQSPNQSGLLPTKVRVIVGKATEGAVFPYWLYQVEQFRSEEEVTQLNHRSNLHLITEWAGPQPLTQSVGPEFFEATSNNEPFYEETEQYLPPPLNIAQVPPMVTVENSATTH